MNLWPLLLLFPLAALAEEDPWGDDDWGDEEQGATWSGFVEAGLGTRFDNDELIDGRNTLEELRWRVETEWQPGDITLSLKADLDYDGIESSWDADLRDLSIQFAAGKNVDVSIGRQVQTWGTGDLLFLNDLFPKDFVSFFAGRDDEYLKAPGNAIRLTRFSPKVSLDFVWTPVFESDVYLTGERFSFFSPLAGTQVAPRPPLSADEPQRSFSNGEFALRLFRTIDGREYSVYAYHGFFKQPTALTESLEPTFAPMSSLGASLRQPLGPGLFNVEVSYYLSRDDREGNDPLLPDSQSRLLAGYEWEAKPNFTVGLQYYVESTPDDYRHLLTNRLTYRAGRDKHTWSLFTFYSPSDNDFYLRPVYNYRHSDQWSLAAGASLFGGEDNYTFFGQLEDASNVYLRIRFHY